MTVSQPPDMEQAARPAKESGPAISRIFCRIIKEPLPDIARRKIRGRISTGIRASLKAGSKTIYIKSKNPETVRPLTAM